VTPWLSYPRIQSANCGPARTRAPANLIVLHTFESPEKPGTARGVANWFAGRLGTAPKASAHFCVGQDAVFQCVALDVVSWAAPGANSRAVNIEQEGRAKQTPEEWADSASRAMLTRSARLCAELVRELNIPPVRIDFAAVRAGAPGICGHHDVTLAFPDKGHGHYDPGPSFPWDWYMAAVADELAKRDTDVSDLAPESGAIAPEFDPETLPVLDLTVPRTMGKHVVLLQERLRYHARIVTVDGTFGPKTHSALVDLQLGWGLKADGICGPKTWKLLLRDHG
jgi:peptidoglycan hydrolase-like protein with peptidoglycan-binding domain